MSLHQSDWVAKILIPSYQYHICACKDNRHLSQIVAQQEEIFVKLCKGLLLPVVFG